MILFGEEPGVPGAVYIAVGSVLTTLVGTGVALVIKYQKNKLELAHQEQQYTTTARKTTIAEYIEIIERLRQDRDGDRGRIEVLEAKVEEAEKREADCDKARIRDEAKREALEERMTGLEELLRDNGIRFRERGPNSGLHKPLPPKSPEDPKETK